MVGYSSTGKGPVLWMSDKYSIEAKKFFFEDVAVLCNLKAKECDLLNDIYVHLATNDSYFSCKQC